LLGSEIFFSYAYEFDFKVNSPQTNIVQKK